MCFYCANERERLKWLILARKNRFQKSKNRFLRYHSRDAGCGVPIYTCARACLFAWIFFCRAQLRYPLRIRKNKIIILICVCIFSIHCHWPAFVFRVCCARQMPFFARKYVAHKCHVGSSGTAKNVSNAFESFPPHTKLRHYRRSLCALF